MLRTKLKAARTPRPRAITALSIFFVAGATISFIANMSLLLPNSFLEPIWRLNPRAHESLSRLGLWAVLMMSTVSMLCAAATRTLAWFKVGVLARGWLDSYKSTWECDQRRARYRAQGNRGCSYRCSIAGVSDIQ